MKLALFLSMVVVVVFAGDKCKNADSGNACINWDNVLEPKFNSIDSNFCTLSKGDNDIVDYEKVRELFFSK